MLKCKFIKCSFSEAACSKEHVSLNVTPRACHVSDRSLFSHRLLCHFSNSKLQDEVGERRVVRSATISKFDGFLQHFGINLRGICCYRPQPHIYLVGPTSARHLGPPVLHHQHLNTFNAVGWNHFPLMRTWWIFFGCFLQAISDQNKCTCTFSCPAPPTPLPPNHYPPTHTPSLATATPPGRVKIDSLASSTRQLRAICSHLGCSSSFCFCDCSSNIIGLKVLEMRMAGGEWRGGHQREGDTKMRSGMKRN